MENRRSLTLHETLYLRLDKEKENNRYVKQFLEKQPREILEKITVEIIEEIIIVIKKISKDKENSSENNLEIISWLANCIKVLLRQLKKENVYLHNVINTSKVIVDVVCKHYKIPSRTNHLLGEYCVSLKNL